MGEGGRGRTTSNYYRYTIHDLSLQGAGRGGGDTGPTVLDSMINDNSIAIDPPPTLCCGKKYISVEFSVNANEVRV